MHSFLHLLSYQQVCGDSFVVYLLCQQETKERFDLSEKWEKEKRNLTEEHRKNMNKLQQEMETERNKLEKELDQMVCITLIFNN